MLDKMDKSVGVLYECFNKFGFDIRVVGGAVRDWCMGLNPHDIDLCTNALPDQMLDLGRKCNLQVIPTGLKHGTVTFLVGKTPYEVTTLRIDDHCDGRHADVVFTTSFEQDASRRDFTINAMSMDFQGKIYDYHGGRDDIKKSMIRFVGDASERVTQDYLRILRFFRFATKFNDDSHRWDDDGLSACYNLKDGLLKLSVERIWMEMSKIIASRKSQEILTEMQNQGILDVLDFTNNHINESAKFFSLGMDAAQAFGVLQGSVEKTNSMADRWKLSNQERARGLWFAQHFYVPMNLQQAKKHLVEGIPREWVMIILESQDNHSDLEYIREWHIPQFPVTGKDLLNMGMPAGPSMGKVLNELKTIWIDRDYTVSKESLIAVITD